MAVADRTIRRHGRLVGIREPRDHSWHRQLHIFLYPFYYIEYGIAQARRLAALAPGFDHRAGAVCRLRRLFPWEAPPLPELFAAAGTRSVSNAELIAPLMTAIGQELERLAP